MAALLHDVIEDSEATNNPRRLPGESVAEIVDGVSKLSKIFSSRDEAQQKTSRRWRHGERHSCDHG